MFIGESDELNCFAVGLPAGMKLDCDIKYMRVSDGKITAKTIEITDNPGVIISGENNDALDLKTLKILSATDSIYNIAVYHKESGVTSIVFQGIVSRESGIIYHNGKWRVL